VGNTNHEKIAEFSVGLGFFLVIVALMVSGATAARIAYATAAASTSGQNHEEIKDKVAV
jgi:hypothetical protein